MNDPKVETETIRRVGRVMSGLADLRDLAVYYDWRDELSVGSFILASDTCFCAHCLAKMRVWLEAEYGDLGRLNTEWETCFETWDEVRPLTTQEALKRRRVGHWNFAPWHDHRAFNDMTLARICGAIKEEIVRHDPEAGPAQRARSAPPHTAGMTSRGSCPSATGWKPTISGDRWISGDPSSQDATCRS